MKIPTAKAKEDLERMSLREKPSKGHELLGLRIAKTI
jgi:hypothetical protein